jgi:ATP-dependent DNA ligase
MLAQKGGVDDIARLEERGYTFDLKVDGVRCLVEVDQGVVRLTSRPVWT